MAMPHPTLVSVPRNLRLNTNYGSKRSRKMSFKTFAKIARETSCELGRISTNENLSQLDIPTSYEGNNDVGLLSKNASSNANVNPTRKSGLIHNEFIDIVPSVTFKEVPTRIFLTQREPVSEVMVTKIAEHPHRRLMLSSTLKFNNKSPK